MSSDDEFQDEEEYDSEEEAMLEEQADGPKTPLGESEFVDGDDDDDGEAEYRPKKKQKKEHHKSSKRHKSSGKLINLKDLRETEAEASSDASEDENEAWAEEFAEDQQGFIINEEEGEPGEETNYMKLNRALREDQTAADYDIVRRIEERSRNQQYFDAEEPEEDQGGLISKTSRMPSILNKLWLVKVVPGMERQIVVQLLQKHFTKGRDGTPLSILSVTAQDHLKGYIYVEANKEAHVREAILNMEGCFQKAVTLVPLKEMVSVLSVPKKKVSLARGDWVRVKKGTYADDVAQVHEYDETQQHVTIKIIPRIDWDNRGYNQDDMDSEGGPHRFKKRGKEIKLPQKLFNQDEIIAIHGQGSVDRMRDQSGEVFLKFDNNKFQNGFLFKTTHLRALHVTDVTPSLDELKAFTKVALENIDETEDMDAIRDREERALLMQAKKLAKPKNTFVKGEIIRVTEGDLKTMTGVITAIGADQKIYFQPPAKFGLGQQEAQASQLQKYFSVGDHVKCINGRYQGDTGLIVKLEEDTATLLSDTAHAEMKALISDLQTCVEVSTGAKLGDYSLLDLVMIGVDTAGVIIAIDNNIAQVLETNGKVRPTKVGEIKSKKDSKNAISSDVDRNPIGKGDQLRVISGPYSGSSGQVKHIHRFWAFLQDKTITKNNGVFVVRTRDCKIIGHSQNSLNHSQRTRPDNNFGTRPSYGFGNKQRTRARDEKFLGQDVEILEGPFKGHTGLVRSVAEDTCYVQLSTDVMKKIKISKEMIRSVRPKTRETTHFGNQTPMRPQTPLHPGVPPMPPMHEGYAPTKAGGTTPMRLTTPHNGDTWSETYTSEHYTSPDPYQTEPFQTGYYPSGRFPPVDYGSTLTYETTSVSSKYTTPNPNLNFSPHEYPHSPATLPAQHPAHHLASAPATPNPHLPGTPNPHLPGTPAPATPGSITSGPPGTPSNSDYSRPYHSVPTTPAPTSTT